MSQQKPDDTIHVGIDLKPEDVTVAESKATYAELQAWVRRMNSIRNRAEEIVRAELIHS